MKVGKLLVTQHALVNLSIHLLCVYVFPYMYCVFFWLARHVAWCFSLILFPSVAIPLLSYLFVCLLPIQSMFCSLWSLPNTCFLSLSPNSSSLYSTSRWHLICSILDSCFFGNCKLLTFWELVSHNAWCWLRLLCTTQVKTTLLQKTFVC